MRLLGLALAGLIAAAASASAQDAPPAGVREACMPSIMSLCSTEAMSGDRPAVRACLIRNFDKLAPECQAAMKAAQAAQEAARASTPPAAPTAAAPNR